MLFQTALRRDSRRDNRAADNTPIHPSFEKQDDHKLKLGFTVIPSRSAEPLTLEYYKMFHEGSGKILSR
jgi:hypothetical protein